MVNSGDLMFGFECPPYRGDNLEAVTHTNPSGSKELILILVINKFGKTQYGKRYEWQSEVYCMLYMPETSEVPSLKTQSQYHGSA